MVSEKQISRAVGFAKPVVTPRFGEEKSQSILAAMRNNFAILAPSVPELKTPTSPMTPLIAVDSLASYRALPADGPQAERLDLIQSFANSWMDAQFDRWIARKVYANRTLHLLFRCWWFWSANRVDESVSAWLASKKLAGHAVRRPTPTGPPVIKLVELGAHGPGVPRSPIGPAIGEAEQWRGVPSV